MYFLGTGFPFRLLLRLAGLRWKYSIPPPYGNNHYQNWELKSWYYWRWVSQYILMSSPPRNLWPENAFPADYIALCSFGTDRRENTASICSTTWHSFIMYLSEEWSLVWRLGECLLSCCRAADVTSCETILSWRSILPCIVRSYDSCHQSFATGRKSKNSDRNSNQWEFIASVSLEIRKSLVQIWTTGWLNVDS
jgi:hypothetical protein